MDKEAREAYLRGRISERICMGLENGEPVIDIAQKIINSLNELGYRKLSKDKPPLLSEVEVVEAQVKFIKAYKERNGATLNFPLQGWLREDCIKEAQREADIKHYESINSL